MEGPFFLTDLLFISGLLLPFFLYAETHYRFRYFFSFLRKREPEIIADAPHRIEPGTSIPILLFVKDADKYCCILEHAVVRLYQSGQCVHSETIISDDIKLQDKWWWKLSFVQPPEGLSGRIDCDVEFTIRTSNRRKTYRNDNYRTSTHRPLSVFLSNNPLPSYKSLYLGEIHSHSTYTDDQVEYGAPIEVSAAIAEAMGLSFFAITDHSYDLDDDPENYLKNHPDIPKWSMLQKEVETIQQRTKVTLIPGEEISCRNSTNQNVHFLLLNNSAFFHGSGDGAERWLQTRSEYTIADIVRLKEKQALTIAAHPLEQVSLLQRWLLGRGEWLPQDFTQTEINGIQFANGILTTGFINGYKLWIDLLLRGKRLTLFAGNDAHGNFNRYRQIGIPFFRITESPHQVFGKMRTGVYAASLRKDDILSAAAAGKTIISDGPVANITDKRTSQTVIGDILSLTQSPVLLFSALSTPEYGVIERICVLSGRVGENKEEILYEEKSVNTYSFEQELQLSKVKFNYLRFEVWTKDGIQDNQRHFCFTTPVWFNRSV